MTVRVCPCEVHHVWGRRFLWKKCLSARLFHRVWALLCLCCHSRISERRFRCFAHFHTLYWCVSRGSQRFDERFLFGSSL